VDTAYTIFTGAGGTSGASITTGATLMIGAAVSGDGGAAAGDGGAADAGSSSQAQYTFAEAAEDTNGNVIQFSGTMTFDLTGATITEEILCPTGAADAVGAYTTTANTITIVFQGTTTTGAAATFEEVLTLAH
jgi:hypothetical protein